MYESHYCQHRDGASFSKKGSFERHCSFDEEGETCIRKSVDGEWREKRVLMARGSGVNVVMRGVEKGRGGDAFLRGKWLGTVI